MDLHPLKSYLKYNYKEIIISLGIILSIGYLSHDLLWFIFYLLLGTGRQYYRYESKLERIKRLRAKGLTEQDLRNIEFVKEWKETRRGRIWRYCFRDGGIITGAGLSVVVALTYFIFVPAMLQQIMKSPNDIFQFIGYSYICGAIIGVITFSILWRINEKRFFRLTDPFNILFASKKALFNG